MEERPIYFDEFDLRFDWPFCVKMAGQPIYFDEFDLRFDWPFWVKTAEWPIYLAESGVISFGRYGENGRMANLFRSIQGSF